MSKRVQTKPERIKKEKARLEKFYADMESPKKGICAGLIERAAFMRIECDELEKFLLEHGWTEKFQQSPSVDPYDRARPQGQAYQTLNANYQKIIKQLDAMLPPVKVVEEGDGFEDFVSGRDEA